MSQQLGVRPSMYLFVRHLSLNLSKSLSSIVPRITKASMWDASRNSKPRPAIHILCPVIVSKSVDGMRVTVILDQTCVWKLCSKTAFGIFKKTLKLSIK
jgi:hypothetical protein